MWIIDFGTSMPSEEAALYEAPFEYVRHASAFRRKASGDRQSPRALVVALAAAAGDAAIACQRLEPATS